jgi:oligopeptidase B
MQSPFRKTAPKARQIPHILTHGDDSRLDPYYWLNERDHPDVIEYLNEENEYAGQYFEHFKDQEESIYKEICGRIPPSDESAPYFENDFWYLRKFEPNKEYPYYFRYFKTLENEPSLILDANKLASGHEYFHLGNMKISPDNRYLAVCIDTRSRRIYSIQIKDLLTGEWLPERISNAGTSLEWSSCSKYLFYTTKDETLRENKVLRHRLSTPTTEDEMIFEESDKAFYVHLRKTKSKKYILIESESSLESEMRYFESTDEEIKPNLFQARRDEVEYQADHKPGGWVIRTNQCGPNFSLMYCPEELTSSDHWRELIAHKSDTLIEDFEIFDSAVSICERSGGNVRIKVLPDTGSSYYIPFGEDVYAAGFYYNALLDSNDLYISFSSPKTPATVFKYNLNNHITELFWQQKIHGGFDSDSYLTERTEAMASDGTLIPISLVYKANLNRKESHPLLLYGYGSYGISVDPTFSLSRISLLDRGFIFAIAHIRGGQELGRNWYETGKFLHKKNTFTDFISCAEFLIKEGYTTNKKLFAYGGSAGGMLMGAIMNLRPELWKGVIAVVPFVDVLTTMLDESIPLTTGEYEEWGNPNDPAYYDYMKSYSPYDNIEAKEYPNIYIRTGYHDSQVQYWEPAKWTAKLRQNQMGDQIILFQCDMDTGHGGSSGRFKQYREIAKDYTFLLSLLD